MTTEKIHAAINEAFSLIKKYGYPLPNGFSLKPEEAVWSLDEIMRNRNVAIVKKAAMATVVQLCTFKRCNTAHEEWWVNMPTIEECCANYRAIKRKLMKRRTITLYVSEITNRHMGDCDLSSVWNHQILYKW